MSLTADEAESEPEDTARETIETKAQETSSTATNSRPEPVACGKQQVVLWAEPRQRGEEQEKK